MTTRLGSLIETPPVDICVGASASSRHNGRTSVAAPAAMETNDDAESAMAAAAGRNRTSSSAWQPKMTEREQVCRYNSKHNMLYLATINTYSAAVIFVVHLISLETLLSIGISVGLTVAIYERVKDKETFDGDTMNWVMLSFAVITPISLSIRMAFGRRELALTAMASLRATLLELYNCHAVWDWGWEPLGSLDNTGRTRSQVDWLEHCDSVITTIDGITHDLTRWLTLPSASRARHRTTPWGRQEARVTLDIAAQIYAQIIAHFATLADLCEVLKREGLPPNEATRVRQWERISLENIEKLRMIKAYRTPQALRSFARLFSIFMPPFYAPYYAELARSLDSLGVGVTFAAITAVALTSLFETISQMEDPFVPLSVLDGVHVQHELMNDLQPSLLTLRRHFFPDAPEFRHAAELKRKLSEAGQQRGAVPRMFNE